MLVGILSIELRLEWCESLKEKRSEIKSLVEKTRSKFKVSVAESDFQEFHKSAEISIAILTPNKALGDKTLDSMLKYIESITQGEITGVFKEYR